MSGCLKRICLGAVAAAVTVAGHVEAKLSACVNPQPSWVSYYCGGWTFNVDMLYWKAMGSNIVYGSDYFNGTCLSEETIIIDDYPFTIPVLTHESRTEFQNPRFPSSFGFRLGASYDQSCSCWGLGIDWTHFKTKGCGKASPQCVTRYVGASQTSTNYDVETEYKLKLDYLDLGIGRDFCLGRCFAGRGVAGVRYARLDQCYESFSDFAFTSDDCQNTDTEQFAVVERHLFNGAGPRVGVDLEWCVGCGWSVYGDAAFSYLMGVSSHCVRDNVDLYFQGFTDPFEINPFTDTEERAFCREESLQGNRPATDLAIGVRWAPVFCSRYRLSFQLGWEHHAFFGQKHAHYGDLQNQLNNCTSTLAVYGITFSTNFSF